MSWVISNCIVLGKGAYGIVFKAIFKDNPNMIVALKHIQCEMES